MDKKISYYWATDTHLQVNGERMLPEEAYKKYPDYAGEIKSFVEKTQFFVRDGLISSSSKSHNGFISSFNQNRQVKSAGYQAFGDASDFVTKYFKINPNINIVEEEKKFELFKNIYTELANQLEFDENYAQEQKEIDRKKGLTPLEIKHNDIERTKRDKKGVCTTFVMRLNDELDKLNIPNCQVTLRKDNIQHAVNLYMIKNNLYIADITKDIIYGNWLKLDKIPPISCAENPNEYLEGTSFPFCYNIDEPNLTWDMIKIYPTKDVIDCVENQKIKPNDNELTR